MRSPKLYLTLGVSGAITVMACLGSVAPVAAQKVQLSVAGGWYDPGGENFGKTDSGAGYDGVVRFGLTDQLQVGVGTQWNMHGVAFTDDQYDVVSVFAEPRLALSRSSVPVIPFIAGRIGWARQSIRVGTASRAATGIAVGGLAGAAFPLGPAVEVETAVTAYYLSFGAFDVDGTTLAGSESTGNVFGLRVALNWRR